MREIKFRAWDKDRKAMLIPSVNMMIDSYNGSTYWDFGYDELKPINAIPMQYIGLKDKNGKEIYEGDVLRSVKGGKYKPAPEGLLCTVEWDERNVSWHGLKDNKRDGEYILSDYTAENCWEVVGNIYENPNLLKK